MTRADIIKQALENLMVIDAISNPSPEDAAIVGRRLDQETARLSEIGLVWWTVDAVPASVSDAFADLVSLKCVGPFPPKDNYPPRGSPAWKARVSDSQSAIASVKSSARLETQRAEYF